MKHEITRLDPADFPEAPEVELIDVTPSGPGAGLPRLTMTDGEEVQAVWEDLTLHSTPEGVPVFLEVGGLEDGPAYAHQHPGEDPHRKDPEDPHAPSEGGEMGTLYRLPAGAGRLFVWGLGGPLEARAAADVSRAHTFMMMALRNPAGPYAADWLRSAALNALSAAQHWPGQADSPEEDSTEAGEEEGAL